jgi:hypothetical protein
MCGCGSTSRDEAGDITSSTGPAWSIKINGPTIRRSLKGRMRLTFIDLLMAALRASITMSSIAVDFFSGQNISKTPALCLPRMFSPRNENVIYSLSV